MTAESDAAEAALTIFKRWWWPDDPTRPFAGFMDLSEAVNRLAMEGQTNPQAAILTLLCRGDLRSCGDITWRKYQWGSEYQVQETGVHISQKRWQDLANLIADETRMLEAEEWPSRQIDLEKLGLKECLTYEWEFGQCRFSTALCPPETSIFNRSYFEEWFSAWDISIWPESVREELPMLEPDADTEPAAPAKSKGGAPRKWDWDGALLHLAALAHHGTNGLFRDDGGDPNQSDIARHLQAWFIGTCQNSPEDSQLRDYGKRFVTELNALKLRDANNPKASG